MDLKLFVLLLLIFSILISINTSSDIHKCNHKIYCNSELLNKIQSSRIYNDSKIFVDLPLLVNPEIIFDQFKLLPEVATIEEIKLFIKNNFGELGSEVIKVEPIDWKSDLKILSEIENKQLKMFVKELNEKWKDLLRKLDHSDKSPEFFSSIYVPNPFIVAGGRFREYYYWDSYWIIEGLLISEMYETAKGMIENFFYIIEKYGMVPNGGRVYYLNRSQPPLLANMVRRYYEVTDDFEFLKKSVKFLDKEYKFWNKYRRIKGKKIKINLNIYNVQNNQPRPESFFEDLETSNNLKTEKEKIKLFKDLASAAESGWDFSSRWFKIKNKISTIQTSKIIPVDLNSILYKVETTLSEFHNKIGNKKRGRYYLKLSKIRKYYINKYLYNSEQCLWNDLNFDNFSPIRNEDFYVSNIFPLWAGIKNFKNKEIECLLSTIKKVINYKGGIPTSLFNSNQQWDYPNAWPPLQFFLVEALENLNNSKAKLIAKNIAEKWIYNNYCTFKNTGYMFEKYNAESIGDAGYGGEYKVQEGFGWTNGVALYFIKKYGKSFKISNCPYN